MGGVSGISADNWTVTLTGSLRPSTLVTVVATSGVQDLSGNALADFRSQFTTGAAFDTTHAQVVGQRPGSGAGGVSVSSSIVLYVNEPLNPGSVGGALHVAQNGTLMAGTVTVRDNGQTIEFVPVTPWQNGRWCRCSWTARRWIPTE